MNERPPTFERPHEHERIKPEMAIDAVMELIDQRGRGAAADFVSALQSALEQGRVPNRVELLKPLEEKPTRDEFAAHVYERLKQSGIVDERDNGIIEVNSKELFAHLFKDTLISRHRKQFFNSDFAATLHSTLANTFADKEVCLEGEDEDEKPKPFFYLPKTRAQAFDPEWIRRQQFHFGLWEIPRGRVEYQSGWIRTEQPVAREAFTTYAASVACALFHPRYGNARRDKDGKLLVQYKDGFFGALKGKWFKERSGLSFFSEGKPQAVIDSTYATLREYAPELFTEGLLREEDFALKQKKEKPYATVSINGEVALFGVSYYLGRQLTGRKIRYESLGDNHLAIFLSGEETRDPVLILDAFSKDDPRLTTYPAGSGIKYRVPHQLSRARSVEQFLSEAKVEGADGYAESKKQLEQLRLQMTLEMELEQKSQVTIWDLTPDVRRKFKTHVVDLHAQSYEFFKLAGDFGQKGLELAVQYVDLPGQLHNIVNVLSRTSEKQRPQLLNRLLELGVDRLRISKEVKEAVQSGRLSETDARKAQFELSRRSTSMLVAMDDYLKSSKGESQSLEALLGKTFETQVFSAIFREAFKGIEGSIDFEQMKAIHAEEKFPSELSQGEKMEMKSVFEANWGTMGRQMVEALMVAFEKKLSQKDEATRFHLLKKDGRIVAFLRFDDRDDLESGALYGGSLNVSPELRGSAIGEVMLRSILDREAKTHVIYADVFPEVLAGTAYVEKFGCVIVGVEEVVIGGEKKKRFLLRRDDQENEKYLARGKEIKELERMAGVRVERFDVRTQKEQMMNMVAEAARKGNVVTRYWHDEKDQNIRFLAIEKALPEVRAFQEAA